MGNFRIIVAHPGRQHSFRLASALKKKGMLCKYITTVYDKENSILMKLVKKCLHSDDRKRAEGRKNDDLLDNDVIQFCEVFGLIELLLNRIDKSRKFYRFWQTFTADCFGKQVAKYAIKRKADMVIMYDTNARTCFEYLKKHAPMIKRLMDVSAANRLYMKNIYESDFEKNPQFANRLKQERKFLWDKGVEKRLRAELDATQFFLAPSQFVKNSLLYSGIDEKSIFLCSYGAEFNSELYASHKSVERPLEVIYVGNVTAMKGIYYLLEAVLRFDIKEVHLTVVGNYDNSDGLFDRYMSDVSFTGRLLHSDVIQKLVKSDVFAFPSLGEGMSLSCLEAMSCGLPCILTENSGADEFIENGVNGFVIQPQSIDAFVEKLRWFVENRNLIEMMGVRAQEKAKNLTWGNYETNVVNKITEIMNL